MAPAAVAIEVSPDHLILSLGMLTVAALILTILMCACKRKRTNDNPPIHEKIPQPALVGSKPAPLDAVPSEGQSSMEDSQKADPNDQPWVLTFRLGERKELQLMSTMEEQSVRPKPLVPPEQPSLHLTGQSVCVATKSPHSEVPSGHPPIEDDVSYEPVDSSDESSVTVKIRVPKSSSSSSHGVSPPQKARILAHRSYPSQRSQSVVLSRKPRKSYSRIGL